MMRTLPILLLCAAAHAADVRVPSAPPPAFADTESVTNAPLGAALALLPVPALRGDDIDLLCEAITNRVFEFHHIEDKKFALSDMARRHSREHVVEALRRIAVANLASTNELDSDNREAALSFLMDFATTNDLAFYRSRMEVESGFPLETAINAVLTRTDSISSELAALTNLLHGARAGDPGFQDVATWEICSRASHSSSLELSADEVEILHHFLITEFPVENRTTAAVWIDRYLTNAVPSWATNEARRAAAERILALPTTPLPFVTNHFVRVLASFPPPER